jgi:aminoglycoside phosphotransferase family enzyme
MDDQNEVISFLAKGANYGKPGSTVERIETHISIIFLVGDRAYKLKRAVRFSYLDYSSPALRKKYCLAEFELNRRTAPALYLRVHSITRTPDGELEFDGNGNAVDWVLEMHRFAQSDLFVELADSNKLTPELMRDLTDVIAIFHTAAETTPQYGGRQGLEETIAGNNSNLSSSCPPLDAQEVRALYETSMEKLSAVGKTLDARRDGGRVRRCHGDLHLRNICLVDGRPTLFDCIEFSDALACIDVLYDLAFLLMDLVKRDLNELASVVFNRYLDLTSDLDGLAALPLFMSARAAVRAHVFAAQNQQHPSTEILCDARSYLLLATTLLRPHAPRLIAIGGLSGSGKSTLAQRLAPDYPPAPGARVIRSDVLRKRLFNVAPETKLPPSAYEPAVSKLVYESLEHQAAAAIAAGYTAIADATFLREEERQRIAEVARRADVPFEGFWLEAPKEILESRIGARLRDASDADTSVLRQQLTYDVGQIGWRRLDATRDLSVNVRAPRSL